MPNKRAEDKVFISAWVPDTLKDALKAWAEKEPETYFSVGDLMTQILSEAVAKHEKKEKKGQPGHNNCPGKHR